MCWFWSVRIVEWCVGVEREIERGGGSLLFVEKGESKIDWKRVRERHNKRDFFSLSKIFLFFFEEIIFMQQYLVKVEPLKLDARQHYTVEANERVWFK